ncbi:MAG: DNA repair protein RadA [Acidimicrobiales bacterium]
MARARAVYRCTDCGSDSPQWVGKCPGCGAWNTLQEERSEASSAKATAWVSTARAQSITTVDTSTGAAMSTGVAELDRVLGGGLVPGSVTLLGGEPGVGKSTLLLQVMASMAKAGSTALLVSAEESMQQVRLRAERLGAMDERLLILAETALPGITAALDETKPDIVVVDSIQTVFDPDLTSAPGSVSQVRDCAHQLVRLAKDRNLACVLVGHVTKDGGLAGPRVLEHVVDTVLSFDGERHHALRLLRAQKHRFGATGELGLFEMTEAGLSGVPDPSGLFLGDRRAGVPGSAVVPTMEGQRPLLVELQALVAPSSLAQPRRSANGLDGNRLSLLLAVLERRAGIGFGKHDVFASAVGGVRIVEPGVDLGLALALASARTGAALPAEVVACAEVGLGGELRLVSRTPRRLAEAARLGFRQAIVPASSPDGPKGLTLHRVHTLGQAIDVARLRSNASDEWPEPAQGEVRPY